MEEAKIVCKDLLSYLQDLPTSVLISLYGYSSACLAVFRELPELSKMYVMRLLYLDAPLSQTVVDSWCNPAALRPFPDTSSHREAITKLQSLHVYKTSSLPGGLQGALLHEDFRRNLRILLCGGGTPWALVGHKGGDDKHARDVAFLNDYANKQWEGVLNFMVGGQGEQGAEQEVRHVLQHSNLMSSSPSGGCNSGMTITTRGFQFLLMERSAQVWFFIINYLQVVTERGFNLLECLTFLFQLSFSTLGKDYSREGMTECQEGLLQHLRMFGLVYQRKRSSRRYYPTKLAFDLVSGARVSLSSSREGVSSAAVQRGSSPGFVVIETNFRVLAYTDSPLQISILSLFCQLQYRFPNMVVGSVTRESIHQALINGITTEQVLSFLRQHAHSQMMSNNPIIPPTVTDQIRLWEIERNRLQFEEGVLYSEFLSASDFDKVKRYAEDLGVLSWSNPGRRLMVVTQYGHEEVRRFWRRQKNN